ncbi:CGNR zinc finger domain-containing protein [Nakamurella sp. YIM 132087]|uniref:CGNR zinc finger domain-containing protein n=1 Tax=Nakamurella alba TaxID=2665158 RepID=A0A7K1FNY8_9ACTN|nr:CGNR zinc finger domain-containing protein [Nakamurella alba]MTD15871.1 CGNR zinc finger domain-containing protein [Nakamurella alba]
MQFNPYGRDPVLLAVDLANDPPTDTTALADRCAGAGLVLECAVTPADLTALASFFDRWSAVVDAAAPITRAELLNGLLTEYSAPPQLTDHAGTGWHLHFRADGLPVHRQVAALVAVGTALHLTGLGMGRLGRCAAVDCTRVYADVSRNGRQRYCSPGCGNRAAVQRHRSRISGSGAVQGTGSASR